MLGTRYLCIYTRSSTVSVKITKVVQTLFGLILVVFGLNGFLHFMPIPEKQGFALEFLSTLQQAKYIFPIIASVMTASGVLLLIKRWVPFALLIQLPISINIFAFHLLHDWHGLIAAYLIFAMNNFLIIRNFKQFKPLFTRTHSI